MTVSAKYAAFSADILALIDEMGASVRFYTAAGATAFDAKAVQDEDDPERFKALSFAVTNPVTLIVSAEGISARPASGTTFQWPSLGGTRYTVVSCESIAPDGGAIAWSIVGSA